jgi:hypothetical protein
MLCKSAILLAVYALTSTAVAQSNGYNQIQANGTNQTQRQILNLKGTGVSCADNAGASSTDCTFAGGSGGSTGSYAQSFTNQTSITLAGTAHQLNTANLALACWDNSAPRVWMQWDKATVDASSYNVVVSFNPAASGTCVVMSGSSVPFIAALGAGSTSGGVTTWTVNASTHLHGVNPNPFVYNSAGTKVEMNSLVVDGSGNITLTALVPDSSLTIKVY